MLRRAIALNLFLLVAELALSGVAVWGLVRLPLDGRGVVVGLAIACIAGVLVTFGVLGWRFLAGVRREIARVRDDANALDLAALRELRRGLGVQAGLRCLVAAAGSGVFAVLAARFTPISTTGLLGIISAVTCGVGVVEVWRPSVVGRVLDGLVQRSGAAEAVGAWRRETLSWNLIWTGVSTGAAGVLVVTLFIHYFVPLPHGQTVLLVAYFPVSMALVAGLWLLFSLRLMRPLRSYLSATVNETRPEVRAGLAVKAYRAVQVLPYTLAGAKTLAFITAALLLYVEGVGLFGVDRETATLMMGATILSTFAAALYEAFWHRTTLRTMLAEIAAAHRLDVAQIRSPLSLRVKMFGGFGLVLFFACAISIFWSFVQVRNLAVAFVQKQSKLKAEGLVERLRTQDKIRGPVRPADVMGLLGQLAGAGEEVYWYLPPSGPAERFAAPRRDSPSLPFVVRTRMRRYQSGVLRLGDLGLVGAFLRIRIGRSDLGSVAVLYPDQTRQHPAEGPQTTALALFFLTLLGLCTGIVALIASDLSAPLQALEKRAGEMARGDLQRPVVIGAEADEVGRLAFALDDMRRSLEEQIRTVEELNIGLEEKVGQRTSALARANEDLREAVASLTRAQDQLVRSEKLASIGQLVAGVAHELNNPINAVGNCIDPLEGSLQKLVGETEATSRAGRDDRAHLVDDIQGMLRVIRNGTHRIQRIVLALSNYARTDGERVEAVAINAVIDETLEIAGHLLADVQVDRSYERLALVSGNSGQLGQVFMNLVANAAHAVARAPAPNIRISTQQTEGWVEVAVSDNGPGIDAALRARIFDPFFTTKEVGQGTGLGLAISHEIVANHGGTLELDASAVQGATFLVRLPVTVA